MFVNGSPESKRFLYGLMTQLIFCFERHQKVEKKVNIDNFEDDEFINSGSGFGSFFDGKKSKGTTKKNEFALQIKDSKIFTFVCVIIREITKDDLQFKLTEATKSEAQPRMTFFLLAVIEFLEVASSQFSGFPQDVNSTIVREGILQQLLGLIKFFPSSDILNQKVFKIFTNIVQSRTEEAPDLIKALFDDTTLISFLIEHGPQIRMAPAATASADEETKQSEEKGEPG
mmetsp:Transcript_15898/g.24502  ORF Transcript_15898/g.24502 Transcript_15898/m.24502 type:complete len:229 (+) Transcript_15898:2129-2815(+)